MSHVPDEGTLRDILLRQLRKSHGIFYDLQTFDRAKEGTPTHTYEFLINAVKEHLTRERTRRKCDLIAKSHGAKFGAPAYDTQRPSSRGGRGRSMSPGSSRSRASSLKNSRTQGEHQVLRLNCVTTSRKANAPEATSASTYTGQSLAPLEGLPAEPQAQEGHR